MKLEFDGTYVHDAEGSRFLAVCADKAKHLGPTFAAAPELLAERNELAAQNAELLAALEEAEAVMRSVELSGYLDPSENLKVNIGVAAYRARALLAKLNA